VTLVFDTNVLFAAFVADGTCADLYRRAVEHGALAVPLPILAELREKLTEKTRLTAAEINAIERNIRREAHLLDDPEPLATPICRDSDDDVLLASINTAHPDALVTGDNDLLVIGEFAGVAILRPREALERFFPAV
jgi:putative PIN family toxin of toxin-antitoxin system